MGGKGSGNPGQARGAGGQFVISGAITIATAEAVDNMQLVEDQTEKLIEVLDRSSTSLDKNTKEIDENSAAQGKNADKTKKSGEEIDAFAINMQIGTSALNQSTGALMKFTSGMEAANLISAERAAELQKNIRVLEIFTGAMEFVLSVLLVKHLYTKMATGSTIAYAASVKVAAASMWKYAAAQAAALAPFLPIIAAIGLFVAVIVIMIKYVDEIDALIGKFTDKMAVLGDIVSGVHGGVTGLTSSFTSLGDAITDNPVTKMVSKAGGAIF